MIRNQSSFLYSAIATQAVSLAKAGLESVRPELVLQKKLDYNSRLKQLKFAGKTYDLDEYDRIFLIGIGCGTALAVDAVQQSLVGLAVTAVSLDPNFEPGSAKQHMSVTSHPTASNAQATQHLLNYGPFSEFDLVIAITDSSANSIVNAGSTLAPDQQLGILNSLVEQRATREEVLAVLVHLAEGRGGGLTELLAPSTILNFVISDELDNYGSAAVYSPFLPHSSNAYLAKKVVDKYNVLQLCNLDSLMYVASREDLGAKIQNRVSWEILASPLDLAESIKQQAAEYGLLPQIYFSSNLTELSFRTSPEWQLANEQSHCLLTLFPSGPQTLTTLLDYAASTGVELSLRTGIANDVCGYLYDSAHANLAQNAVSVVAENLSFNVGTMNLKID